LASGLLPDESEENFMKTFMTAATSSLLIIALVACGQATRKNRDELPAKQPSASVSATENDKTKQTSNGQPGQVIISGAGFILSDEGGTGEHLKDSNILRLQIESGQGVERNRSAKFAASLEKSKLEKIKSAANASTLINVGCSDDQIKRLAIKANLEKKNIPQVSENDLLEVQANTIVLCGDLNSKLANSMLSIKADTLVLVEAKLSRLAKSNVGMTDLSANKIILSGTSSIELRIASIEQTGELPTISLGAADSVISQEQGVIVVKSIGASSISTEKAKR
jgi:hypothetical protein